MKKKKKFLLTLFKILVQIFNKFIRKLIVPLNDTPDFLIIGAQKSGTTSLFYYLSKHPNIIPSSKKEIHFFDKNYRKGLNWYKNFFPTIIFKLRYYLLNRSSYITGEATPDYLFYPYAPMMVYHAFPKVKLIILLRNPIKRAYSHFKMQKNLDVQELSFEELVDFEINKNIPKNYLKKSFKSKEFITKTIVSRGLYYDQIRRWLKHFSRDQILVLKSKRFFNQTSQTLEQIYKFLDLSKWDIKEKKTYMKGNYKEKMNLKTQKKLYEFYKPYNKKLYSYLKKYFNWESNEI